MATTITSLALDIAAEKSVRAVRAKLAPLGAFATSFAAAQAEAGDTIKVPVFARGTAAEFASGTNDYTSASSAGVSGVSIELNKHPWQSQRLLPDDAMETDAGRDWVEQTTVTTVEAVAAYMAKTVYVDIMKDTNVQSLTISGATARAKVAKMRKDCIAKGINPRDAALILPYGLYTDLCDELPYNILGDANGIRNADVANYLGFGGIYELQEAISYQYTGTETTPLTHTVTLDAMIVAKDSVGVATRLPIVMNPEKFDVSTLTVPEVGPWSFQIRATGTAAVDAKFLGAEIIFGSKVLQPTKVLVASTDAT